MLARFFASHLLSFMLGVQKIKRTVTTSIFAKSTPPIAEANHVVADLLCKYACVSFECDLQNILDHKFAAHATKNTYYKELRPSKLRIGKSMHRTYAIQEISLCSTRTALPGS